MATSRIRQIREWMALQQEIARRLNRPIDLDRAAGDLENMGAQMVEQNENSLIPLTDDQIGDLIGSITGPSITDQAMQLAQRKNIQARMGEADDDGRAVSGPMIASIMQLDR